jgi:hypothetical protein
MRRGGRCRSWCLLHGRAGCRNSGGPASLACSDLKPGQRDNRKSPIRPGLHRCRRLAPGRPGFRSRMRAGRLNRLSMSRIPRRTRKLRRPRARSLRGRCPRSSVRPAKRPSDARRRSGRRRRTSRHPLRRGRRRRLGSRRHGLWRHHRVRSRRGRRHHDRSRHRNGGPTSGKNSWTGQDPFGCHAIRTAGWRCAPERCLRYIS